MAERKLLMDVVVVPCNCNLQVWVEGDAFHVGPCCESCKRIAVEAVRHTYQGINVVETD
jgi:hypothetical protein